MKNIQKLRKIFKTGSNIDNCQYLCYNINNKVNISNEANHMSKQKELGQYMTSDFIVKLILNEINYTDPIHSTIMEPSFGDGAFLTKIVEYIILECNKHNLSKENVMSVLQSNVFGIEKDPILYQKTINKLNKILEKYSISKIDWTKQLICGDTLLLYHQFENTFDYVVGNPPFVRIHNISNEYRTVLKDFQFTDGMIDLYILFYEIGIKMLKKTGKLGFITPNSFLKNTSQQKFRNYIINNYYLWKLYDFKNSKIFPDASTYTCICILNKNSEKLMKYREYNMETVICENIFEMETFMNKSWNFSNKNDMRFLKDNEKYEEKIKNITTVQNGICTNLDAVYIRKFFVDKKLSIPYKNTNSSIVYFEDINEKIIEIETDLLKPCVKISTYNGIPDNTYIIFPYKNNKPISENELKDKYPKTYFYLLSNYDKLKNRDLNKDTKWYLFARSQGLKHINEKKLIFKTIIEKQNPKIIPYILNDDTIVYSGIYITTDNDIEEIKKIFESKDFARYCSLVGKDMNGGYVSVSSKMVKNYGIKE